MQKQREHSVEPYQVASTQPVDPTFRTRNVARGLGSLAIQNIITSSLAFVFLAVLLRLTSSSEYTAYSSVAVILGVTVTASTFALQYASARYIAMYMKSDEKKAWAVAKSICILSLIFSAIATGIFEVASPELSLFFMRGPGYAHLFELGGIWLFSYSFSLVLQGIIQGTKKYVFLAKILTVSRVVMLTFAIVTLELFHSVDYAIIAWVLYYVILIAWPLRTIAPFLLQKSDGKRYYREVLGYTLPLAVASILGIVSSSGDSIVLGGYTSSLGAYNAAIQISAILYLVIITPLITILLPEASSSSKREIQTSNVLRLSIRFLIIGLLPASLLMAALSKQLLLLFSGGGNYLAATGVLEILTITYLFYGLQSITYSMLQATGLTIQALMAGIAACGADIGLAFLLVPKYGMSGGAASRVFEAIIGMAVSIYFVRHHLGNLDSSAFYLKGIIASLIPFGVVFALSNIVSNKIITLIPYSIIGVAIYFACIKVTKLLSEEDRTFVTQLIPMRFQKLFNALLK